MRPDFPVPQFDSCPPLARACRRAELMGVPQEVIDTVRTVEGEHPSFDEATWMRVIEALNRGFVFGWSASFAA